MTPHAVRGLQGLLAFIAVFHVAAGAGLMFSRSFQQFAVAAYGADLPWDAANIYFVRIIGSFAFAMGIMAAIAARDPLRHSAVVVGFTAFFVLRNVHRHLYSAELYAGFGVSPRVNELTTLFFGVQALALGALLWAASRR